MKKFIKRIGKLFTALKHMDESKIRQSVLLIDGSFILPNNFALIIKGVQKKFSNARLVVLTFQDKKEFLKDNFPEVEIIVGGRRIRRSRYQLALQLLFLLRQKFNFIILSSLDISLLSISLMFARCPVFLHNRWMEWYRIRKRTLLDILRRTKSADTKRRVTNRGIKEIIKSFGRIFVILSDIDEREIESRILIEDNGYTEIGHVITAVRNAEKIFINPDITILTFESRKEGFINNFPDIKLISVKENGNKYKLAIEMFRMRSQKFNYVILTALDISPIAISFLFMKARVLLYNRWHQWWSLRFRNLFGYFKWGLIFLVMVPLFIYLFIISSIILIRTSVRLRLAKWPK